MLRCKQILCDYAAVLQCVAVYCSVLQCIVVCCSVLQRVAVCCSVLQCVAVCCSVLQCVAVCCSVLQCVAVCCSCTFIPAEWLALLHEPLVFREREHFAEVDDFELMLLQIHNCSVLQCVGVCCRCVAIRCSGLDTFIYIFMSVLHLLHSYTYSWVCCMCCIHNWVRVENTYSTLFRFIPVLQCVAVCCSVLQCVAVCCSVLQCVAALYLCLYACMCITYTYVYKYIFTYTRTHT